MTGSTVWKCLRRSLRQFRNRWRMVASVVQVMSPLMSTLSAFSRIFHVACQAHSKSDCWPATCNYNVWLTESDHSSLVGLVPNHEALVSEIAADVSRHDVVSHDPYAMQTVTDLEHVVVGFSHEAPGSIESVTGSPPGDPGSLGETPTISCGSARCPSR